MDAARLAFARNDAVGFGTDTLPDSKWHFIPLRTQRGSVGVVGIARDEAGAELDADERALLATLAEQTAAALERAFLAREMAAAQNAAETERVRNILLASISHDFRTPLASILGSATSLLEYRDKLELPAQNDLLQGIKIEAEGLDRMVSNLLAMTRIDAGALELRRDWVDLREVVERVVSAARRRRAGVSLELDLPADMPMIAADAILIEQALGNVVNNAAVAYAARNARCDRRPRREPMRSSLRVTDDGPGHTGRRSAARV